MRNPSFVVKLTKGISNRIKTLMDDPYRKVGLNWFMIKYLKHLSVGKERSMAFYGKKLYYVSPQELFHGLEEIFVQQIYKQTLQENAYILDCGANIGLSVIYLKQLFPNAIIEAFEPDEKNYRLLEKNIKSFDLKNVVLHKKAVWVENTMLHFLENDSMNGKIDIASHDIAANKTEAVRLKDFLAKKVDFLKIDIEGAEYSVLLDIVPSLGNVNNMFVEYHGKFNQLSELLDMLSKVKDAGFKFYIKEAASVYDNPFVKENSNTNEFDLQLNIFCFR